MNKRTRALALLAAAGLAATAARAELQPLVETELAQVHAAGLDAPALQLLTPGQAPALQQRQVRDAMQEHLLAMAQQQQGQAQLRLAADSLQLGGGVMQTLSLATLATPLAPLFLPGLVFGLPFLGVPLPPPKQPGQGG